MATVAENLCTNCGLCCDGSLFADVELGSFREATMVEGMGLTVDESDDPGNAALLALPCSALNRKRCTIYGSRPKCCRTFECRVLQEVNRGSISLERARAKIDATFKKIAEVNGLLAGFGEQGVDKGVSLRDRCSNALDDYDGSVEAAALDRAMMRLERWMERTFLRESR